MAGTSLNDPSNLAPPENDSPNNNGLEKQQPPTPMVVRRARPKHGSTTSPKKKRSVVGLNKSTGGNNSNGIKNSPDTSDSNSNNNNNNEGDVVTDKTERTASLFGSTTTSGAGTRRHRANRLLDLDSFLHGHYHSTNSLDTPAAASQAGSAATDHSVNSGDDGIVRPLSIRRRGGRRPRALSALTSSSAYDSSSQQGSGSQQLLPPTSITGMLLQQQKGQHIRRPSSPSRSSVAPSSISMFRDPEAYRRKVESIRAEAGTSWLNAFVELQSQDSASPGTAEAGNASPSSKNRHPDDTFSTNSFAAAGDESSNIHRVIKDTDSIASSAATGNHQGSSSFSLPKFLFPRRKPAKRNEIPKSILSSTKAKESDEDKACSSIGKASVASSKSSDIVSQNILGSPKSFSTGTATPHIASQSPTPEIPLTETQQAAADIPKTCPSIYPRSVTLYHIITYEESPFSTITIPDTSKVISRRLYSSTTPNDIKLSITDSDTNMALITTPTSSNSDGDEQEPRVPEVANTFSLDSLLRLEQIHCSQQTQLKYRLEFKTTPYDYPMWIDIGISNNPKSTFIQTLKSAIQMNWERPNGKGNQVYRQGRCVKCNWTGRIDKDFDLFDLLPQSPVSANQDTQQYIRSSKDLDYFVLSDDGDDNKLPKKIQNCLECGRNYLVEFYGLDGTDPRSMPVPTSNMPTDLQKAAAATKNDNTKPPVSLPRKMTWKSLLNPLQLQLSIKKSLKSLSEPDNPSVPTNIKRSGSSFSSTSSTKTSTRASTGINDNSTSITVFDEKKQLLCIQDKTRLTSRIVGDIEERASHIAVAVGMPFGVLDNSLSLYLQLSVFKTDDEKLYKWVPSGLIVQSVPGAYPSASSIISASLSSSSQQQSGSIWSISGVFSSSKSTAKGGKVDGEECEPQDSDNNKAKEEKSVLQKELQAQIRHAYSSKISERPIYFCQTNLNIYIFTLRSKYWDEQEQYHTQQTSQPSSPTSKNPRTQSKTRRLSFNKDIANNHPEKYLRLLYLIPLNKLKRLDVGPNRQYITLHVDTFDPPHPYASSAFGGKIVPFSSLFVNKATTASVNVGDHASPSPAGPPNSSSTAGGTTSHSSSKPNSKKAKQTKPSTSNFLDSDDEDTNVNLKGGSIGPTKLPNRSVVIMIRDKVVCSDLLDSLVEVLYDADIVKSPRKQRSDTATSTATVASDKENPASSGGLSGQRSNVSSKGKDKNITEEGDDDVNQPAHRIINHDVEWAMHHLQRQVFLKPGQFAELLNDPDNNAADTTVDTVDNTTTTTTTTKLLTAEQSVTTTRNAKTWFDGVRSRELNNVWNELFYLSGCGKGGPGALVDPASSTDNVIIDKVTYEFLKLYYCVGWVPKYTATPTPAGTPPIQPTTKSNILLPKVPGLQPRTVVATNHFLYLVRERIDIWPPPARNLTKFYKQWQTTKPPTVVTSDPDTYDPESITQLLQAHRSRANSSVANSSSISALTRSPASSTRPHTPSAATTAAGSSSAIAGSLGNISEKMSIANRLDNLPLRFSLSTTFEWMAEHVAQYDRVERIRPIECLKKIEVRSLNVAILPRDYLNSNPSSSGGNRDDELEELEKWGLDGQTVMGCTASGWASVVRLTFDPLVPISPPDITIATINSDGNDNENQDGCKIPNAQNSTWDLFFATDSGAREFISSIMSLAKEIDMNPLPVLS
ncbi:hypothetical protein H4219_002930 [Mycoemilia scoparia]|uniref:Uncharacterized protein n=1 Tax=Mycoemilia scoparia TaxID=417184 RepID=A0A9W8A5P0_9FUNG|nr:hypothetical protein H4219_002930 [Mycoemilia scoparia]